jgi:predicted CXXCH cytochrome family protein
VKLDGNGEVQCTSCHEAHDNSNGNFLVRPNNAGALCSGCHVLRSWASSAHATSSAVVTSDVAAFLGADPTSTSQNACKCCHRPHGAGSHAWILHQQNISATCLPCHKGGVASSNIEREVIKISSHGDTGAGSPGAGGGPYLEGTGVSCADCHNPHAAGSSEGVSGNLPRSLTQVAGVNLGGTPVEAVSYEHELCLRCHGDAPASVPSLVSRVIVQSNKRLQFQATNPSFHPVGNPGANPSVPSLLPPLTTSSTIGCGDCHDADDTRKLGGTGPAGPHGSIYRPLLARRYDTLDFSVESPAAYSLCYRCHQRDSILRDDSFKEHKKHVVEEEAPCSVCHDPHGISSAQGSVQKNSHLINFDRSVVFPNGAGRLEFVDLGFGRGECYLSCHGEDHNPESY